MLRPEDVERLRELTPAERVLIGLDLTDLAWRFLATLSPEEEQRRLDLAREPWNPPPPSEGRTGKVD